jgi:hypothetical protein
MQHHKDTQATRLHTQTKSTEEQLTQSEEHSLPRRFWSNSRALYVKSMSNKVALGQIIHADYHTNNP